MRTIDELIESANKVFGWARVCGGQSQRMLPLFSGGHDSFVATHLASQQPEFDGTVNHINTGIGAAYTRRFVESVCEAQGWKLRVFKSPETYEKFVRDRGFPGPGMHGFAYNRLKDRCVRQMTEGKTKSLLITGCRSQESVRRMGHVEPVKIGEVEFDKRTGKKRVVQKKRIWTAPCHDWSKAEQQLYMDEFGLPTNKMKVLVGLSGECFCGSFAAPGELELLREHAPEVAQEIARLTVIATECGKPNQWGCRPSGKVTVEPTGPLCSSCDRRAVAAGVVTIEGT